MTALRVPANCCAASPACRASCARRPDRALVGDAGYFKDPITAHGISDALRDAELLATAVLIGTDAALRTYQSVRDDLSVSLFDLTDTIASFAWRSDELAALHRRLSDEMKREAAHLSPPSRREENSISVEHRGEAACHTFS
jgi:2-polyprenyl-6-methoxyphenol hydroxylase-like FAD-dependent oxidoreductase